MRRAEHCLNAFVGSAWPHSAGGHCCAPGKFIPYGIPHIQASTWPVPQGGQSRVRETRTFDRVFDGPLRVARTHFRVDCGLQAASSGSLPSPSPIFPKPRWPLAIGFHWHTRALGKRGRGRRSAGECRLARAQMTSLARAPPPLSPLPLSLSSPSPSPPLLRSIGHPSWWQKNLVAEKISKAKTSRCT